MNERIDRELEELAVPLPITRENWAIAQQFASEQPTAEKAENVRLNTLAVLGVNDYLKLLGMETDLASSDSWNPVMRLCGNVADLEVVNIGRLECRPLAIPQRECCVPPEVWEQRIGYVFIQLDEENREAKLLGFLPTVTEEEVKLDRIQPPESLIDRLQEFNPERVGESVETRSRRIHLSQWLDGIWEIGWQAVATLFDATAYTPAMSFRTDEDLALLESEDSAGENLIQQGKIIHLGKPGEQISVILLVGIERLADDIIEVAVQVHPQNLPHLPAELKLNILDETDTVFMDAISRRADNYVQLQFRGNLGERFKINVSWGETSRSEDFEI